jgi:predicted permease
MDMAPVLRLLREHRGYVTLGALTLALSVGANVAVFCVVNALWLRTRFVPDSGRVVMVLGTNEISATSEAFHFGEPGLECYLRSQGIFRHVAGQVATSGENVGYLPHLQLKQSGYQAEVLGVTDRYFSVIGGTLRGRDFTSADNEPRAELVAIISDRLWREAFGGDPNLVGTVVAASPKPVRVVGVAPRGFQGVRLGERTDMWVPAETVPQLTMTNAASGQSPPLLALARLEDGITLAEAQRRMAAGVRCQGSLGGAPAKFSVVPIAETYGGPQSRTIITRESDTVLVVATTTGFVFAAGCATLLGLVVMHLERRRHEFSVRLAIGGSSLDLGRLLAVELSVLAVLGLAGALAVAVGLIALLPSLPYTAGVDFARLDLSLDWRVLTVGALAVVLTLALAAVTPIYRSRKHNLASELASSSRNTPSSLRLRRGILGFQVGATAVVLVGAGLFVRTVQVAFGDGAGFDLAQTLFVNAQVSPNSMPSARGAVETMASSQARRGQDLLDNIAAIAGVALVEVGEAPIGLDQAVRAQRFMSVVDGPNRWSGTLRFARVGPLFHQTLGLPLVAGRWLTISDVVSPSVGVQPVIVTSALAQSVWSVASPIGRQFTIGESRFEVVGVVGDHAQGSLRLNQSKGLYTATNVRTATRTFVISLVVRTVGQAGQLAGRVRMAVRESFPEALRVDVATGGDIVARDTGRELLGASVFTAFGVLSLCLGATGTFGVVSYYVGSRRRDIGVRTALGATARRLRFEVMMTGMVPVLLGIAIGLAVAAGLAKAAVHAIYGVIPLDPPTYIGVGLLMISAATVAAGLAAKPIAHVSPLDVLRVQ